MTVRKRRLVGVAVLVALLVLVAIASIGVGALSISIGEVWHGVFTPSGTPSDDLVQTLRIPRTVVALIVGVALGVAGALIQGHTRNPLADTGLLGLNAGAAFLVVIAIYAFGFTGPSQYVWFALAGSLIAGAVVFGIASVGSAAATPMTLALAGAAVTLCLQAMTSAVVVSDIRTLDSYRFWVIGSVAGRGLDIFWQVLPFIAVGLILAAANTPALNVLNLGEDVARGLGTNVASNRAVGLIAVTLLAGGATAAAGPVAFVGLVVPHVARAITGPDYRWLVPYAGLLGGLFLLTADVVGRIVVRPAELDVGIVLALAGAPFFIALVRKRRLVAL